MSEETEPLKKFKNYRKSDYNSDISDVKEGIKSVKENAHKVAQFHNELLLQKWKAKKRVDLEKKWGSLVKENRQFNEEIANKLRGLQTTSNSEVERMREEWQKELDYFIKEEKDYYKKLKDQLVRCIKQFGMRMSEEEIIHRIDQDDITEIAEDKLITEEKRKEWKEVRERYSEMLRIDTDIKDLEEIGRLEETISTRLSTASSEEDIEAAFIKYKKQTSDEDEDGEEEDLDLNFDTELQRIRKFFVQKYKQKPMLFMAVVFSFVIFLVLIIGGLAIKSKIAREEAGSRAGSSAPEVDSTETTTRATTTMAPCVPDGPNDVC